MRIIGGIHRGRPLRPPKNLNLRPTTDKAKEALFNILNHRLDFQETTVLDLFAGTGSMAYEFASRGCPSVVAVERDYKAHAFIRQTAEELHLPIKAAKANVFSFIKHHSQSFDLIFADPPYAMEQLAELPDLILLSPCLKKEGCFILEHPAEYNFTQHPAFLEERHYSKVHFSFFKTKAN